MIFIGIDPGSSSGAIGAIDHNGNFVACGDITSEDGRINARQLRDDLARIVAPGEDAAIVVEDVWCMPGQGISSTSKFMRATGAIEAVARLTFYPVTFVRPQAWKKHHNLIGKDKSASLELARRLWPAANLKLVKHHNRADALLLSAWLSDTLS